MSSIAIKEPQNSQIFGWIDFKILILFSNYMDCNIFDKAQIVVRYFQVNISLLLYAHFSLSEKGNNHRC